MKNRCASRNEVFNSTCALVVNLQRSPAQRQRRRHAAEFSPGQAYFSIGAIQSKQLAQRRRTDEPEVAQALGLSTLNGQGEGEDAVPFAGFVEGVGEGERGGGVAASLNFS